MEKKFKIGNKTVGDNLPCYIIAEIGSNHNQDINKAKELISAAKDAGANAAKFQSLNFEKVHLSSKSNNNYKKLYDQIQFQEDWYAPITEYSKKLGIHFFTSVTYLESIDFLLKYRVPCIKIASAQFDIFPEIIEKAALTNLPLIMSSGLSDYGGIERMISLVNNSGNKKVILMHCVTEYPSNIERTNLKLINTYKQAFGCLVGYSDHTLGIAVSVGAVALGAAAIEKHITLDKKDIGPDHHFSIDPREFSEMVKQIRQVEKAIGSGVKKPLNNKEKLQKDEFLYKWIINKPIKQNERISRSKLKLRRIDGGIDRDKIDLLECFRCIKNLEVDTVLNWKDLVYDK